MTQDTRQADIEVTDHMIEIGYNLANLIGPAGVVCERDWLEKVYRAMRAAEGQDGHQTAL